MQRVLLPDGEIKLGQDDDHLQSLQLNEDFTLTPVDFDLGLNGGFEEGHIGTTYHARTKRGQGAGGVARKGRDTRSTWAGWEKSQQKITTNQHVLKAHINEWCYQHKNNSKDLIRP